MTVVKGDNVYCDKTDIQTLLGAFDVPAAWTDALLETAMLRAAQRIDAICGTHFGSRAMTVLADGAGIELLMLDDYTRWPINAVTDVYYREEYAATDTFEASGELVDQDYYRIHASKHALERTDGSLWVKGKHNYRVRGTFGSGSVPEQIKAASVLLAREEITPGSSEEYEKFTSEHWPDGYSYTRGDTRSDKAGTGKVSTPMYTGIAAVDGLLAPFVVVIPQMGIIDF